ncbi:hypothetical protein [Agromyces sp. SYSU T00194]|uniref:hypothetical protein n=1 Tax=Agromyces chitinivorans TaxID=3158560 RepID=UPI003391C61A
MGKRNRLAELAESNITKLITGIIAFIVGALVTLIFPISNWFKIPAALLAGVSLVALVVWIRDPLPVWKRYATRRISIIAVPLLVSGGLLTTGALVHQAQVVLANPAYLIVLDSSAAMGESFDGAGSKLEAAQGNVAEHLFDFGEEQLGLSTYGVEECDAEEQLSFDVPIASGRSDAIKSASSALEASGASNVVTAGIQAINALKGFTGDRQVLLLAGSVEDGCGRNLEDLKERANLDEVPIKFDLIGLGLSESEKEDATDASLGEVAFADTQEELDAALEDYLFTQRVRAGIERLQSFLGTAIDPINDSVSAMNQGDVEAAETAVENARAGVDHGRRLFANISKDERTAELGDLEDMFEDQMERLAGTLPELEHWFDVTDDAYASGSPGGAEVTEAEQEAMEEAIKSWNAKIREYNDANSIVYDEVSDLLTNWINDPET